MITGAMIYKDDTGRWTTDIRGDPTLLSVMTHNTIHLVDGTTVGRWHWPTWEAAHRFVFGPDPDETCTCRCQEGRHCGGCKHTGCGYSRDAWELRA